MLVFWKSMKMKMGDCKSLVQVMLARLTKKIMVI